MAKKDVRLLVREAALSLFVERGYDATTTADVAERVGITERTLFRHFSDKRELVFDDEASGRDLILAAIEQAPPTLGALDALFHAFASIEDRIVDCRSSIEPRFRLVASSPALQEREATKLLAFADAMVERLERRGVRPLEALLTARVGMVALGAAVEAWLEDPASGFGDALALTHRGLMRLVTAEHRP